MTTIAACLFFIILEDEGLGYLSRHLKQFGAAFYSNVLE